jgi:putative oxidoreductase
MINTPFKSAQFYFRWAQGIGFLLPVADRIGWLGTAGKNSVDWGNWPNFVAYTNTLMPFLNRDWSSIMGLLATIAEILIGLMFVIGYKIRIAAIFSFLLTLTFGLCMFIFLGPKSPFTYSVFADSAGSLLLACVPVYHWSLDNYLSKTK